MKLLLTIPFTLLLLSGCQTTGTPDNREWTHLACSGASDWTACWNQAEKRCPRGFDIANQQEDRVSLKREVDIACKR